jgi:hypothetical protein
MAIQLSSEEKQALRDVSQDVKDIASAIWDAPPAQIETAINNNVTDLQAARNLLIVLALQVKYIYKELID